MKNILPHEKDLLCLRLARGEAENRQVAIDMQNAIENGNQWHDNAEYDEAIERMKRIDSMYGPVLRLLGNCVVIEYPRENDSKVQLGSLVGIRQDNDRFNVLLVGQVLTGSEQYEEMWRNYNGDDIDLYVTTTDALMGQALIGCDEGDIASYRANNRLIKMEINSIDQNWLQLNFKKEQ